MLCEKCGIREANIQYTEVINGAKTEHHFCAQCAREMDFGPYSAIFDGEFPLGKLLSGLLGIEDTSRAPDKLHQVVCPTCGTSYGEFIKNSRFGCADCYSVFGPLMEESLKQLQGNTSHTGKKPKHKKMLYKIPEAAGKGTGAGSDIAGSGIAGSGIAGSGSAESGSADYEHEEEIMELGTKLKEALQFEDYEAAALCRDRIRELKKGHETNA